MGVGFGLMSLKMEDNDLGVGPGGLFVAPRYSACSNLVVTPNNVEEAIDLCRLYGITAAVNLQGNSGQWVITDANGCKIVQHDIYEEKVRRFSEANLGTTLYNKLHQAFLDQVFIGYCGDELLSSGIYCGSVTKAQMNTMAGWYKELFPGCLTAFRVTASSMNPAPTGGWTNVDYCWCQFIYNGNPCNLADPIDCFNEQILLAEAVDLGVIPGFNWLNSKDGDLWDCLNSGSSSCKLDGQSSKPEFNIMPPHRIKELVDAVVADARLAPFCTGWQHIHSAFTPQEPYRTYELRSDFVDAWRYGIAQMATTADTHAWRTAKGVDPDPGPPPPAEPGDWTEIGYGTVAKSSTSTSNLVFPVDVIDVDDLLYLACYSRDGSVPGRNPECPAGWTEAGRVDGGATFGEIAIFYKLATTEGQGGTGNDHSYVTITWATDGNTPAVTQIAQLRVFRGALLDADCLDVVSVGDTWGASTSLGILTGITTSVGGALVIVAAGRQNDFGTGSPVPEGTVTPLSGGTDLVWGAPRVEGSTFGSDAALVTQHAIFEGTLVGGTVTGQTFLTTTSPTGAGCGLIVAFKPLLAEATGVPVLAAIGNKDATVGSLLQFTASATGGGVTYSLTGDATGAVINANTGTLSWTPTATGDYSATIIATNASGSDSETITISVRIVPVLATIGAQSVTEQQLLTFTASATGDDVVYSLSGSPPGGASIGASTGVFQWTPGLGDAGSSPYTITVVATNPSGSDSEAVVVTVADVAPVLAVIGNRSVNEEDLLRIVCSATNPAAGTLVFSLTGSPPSGASITSDGIFTWEPAAGTAGDYSVTVQVSDGTNTDSETFTVTVTDLILDATSVVIEGLLGSTSYDVRIAHLDEETSNLGPWATGIEYATTSGAVPAAPTVSAVSGITKTAFTVNWANGITGIGVTTVVEYRQVGAVDWTVISGIASGVVLQAITGLVAGTAYDVRVKHVSSGVDSPYDTEPAYATTTANPPSVGTPGNVTFTQV